MSKNKWPGCRKLEVDLKSHPMIWDITLKLRTTYLVAVIYSWLEKYYRNIFSADRHSPSRFTSSRVRPMYPSQLYGIQLWKTLPYIAVLKHFDHG